MYTVRAKSLQSCLWPEGLCPPESSWDSPGKNTGVRCCVLLHGIFPTQGSNPCLLNWQVDSFTTESPGKPTWNAQNSFYIEGNQKCWMSECIKGMLGEKWIFELLSENTHHYQKMSCICICLLAIVLLLLSISYCLNKNLNFLSQNGPVIERILAL